MIFNIMPMVLADPEVVLTYVSSNSTPPSLQKMEDLGNNTFSYTVWFQYNGSATNYVKVDILNANKYTLTVSAKNTVHVNRSGSPSTLTDESNRVFTNGSTYTDFVETKTVNGDATFYIAPVQRGTKSIIFQVHVE